MVVAKASAEASSQTVAKEAPVPDDKTLAVAEIDVVSRPCSEMVPAGAPGESVVKETGVDAEETPWLFSTVTPTK